MALTYAAPTVGATAVAALSAGTLVAALFDGENNRSRNYIPGAVQNGVSTQNASTQFPQIVSVTQIQATDPVSGTPKTGQVKVVLQPGSADVVNVASVQTVYMDPNVVALTVSGTF